MVNFTKYIDFNVFMISLCLGLFFVYVITPEPVVVYKYPTDESIKGIVYQYKNGKCVEYEKEYVDCTEGEGGVVDIK